MVDVEAKIDNTCNDCKVIIDYSDTPTPEGFANMSYIYAHGELEDGYDILAGNKAMIDAFEKFGAESATQRHLTGITFNSNNNKDVNTDLYMWKADYGHSMVIKGLLVNPTDEGDVKYAKECMEEEKVFI